MALEKGNLNNRCKRYMTTNQDEFRNPVETKINRFIESEEMARYEDCMACKKAPEQDEKATARHEICCNIQSEMREPTFIPDDYHINPKAKCKAPWCRCLPTGDPNCYDEVRGEKDTDRLCACKKCYNQMEDTEDSSQRRVYSSTNFLSFRDPNYPYIATKMANQKAFKDRFLEYKAKVDAEDALKAPKIGPAPPEEEDRVDPNCMGLNDKLPPAKFKKPWKADETWWRTETDPCRKGILRKYLWTSTYREMLKDGGALPFTKREIPMTCKEINANPIRNAPELAPRAMLDLGNPNFENWDKPQVRTMAGRCDTISNRPDLCYDTYFKEQNLCRAAYARCPDGHEAATKENMDLVRKEKLRLCYDRPIPGYAGYDCMVAPPVCKVKKNFNRWDPYECMSIYQREYIFHPEEFYASPMRGLTPDDFAKMGISMSPLNTLSNMPLPDAQRLSCYLECDLKECPRGNEEICRASDCHRTLVDEGQGKTADTPFIMQNRDNPQPCSG